MPEATATQATQPHRRQNRRGPFIGAYVEPPTYETARRLAAADGIPVNQLVIDLIAAEADRRQRRAALEAEIAALN